MDLIFQDNQLPAGTAVATVGLFDGVHLGHRHILSALRLRAAALGLQSMVVTFDQHPQHTLRPMDEPVMQIMAATDRIRSLDREGVDLCLVLEFTDELAALTAREFITMLRDRYGVAQLVMGFNNHMGSDRADFARCEALGAELGVTVTRISQAPQFEVSSSLIRNVIAGGDVATARRLLGDDFIIRGTVEHGAHNGTAIGFPTANVRPDSLYQLMPAPGAYAVFVHLPDDEGEVYFGMAGVGHRPTVDDDDRITLEVNLFDYPGDDLYDHAIVVYFVERLRNEMKFDSLDALRCQLEDDRDVAEAMIAVRFGDVDEEQGFDDEEEGLEE